MKSNAPETPPSSSSRLRRWSTSGWMTPVLIGLVCLGLLLVSYEHTRGNIHRLRTTVESTPPDVPASNGPGGQDPLVISRHPSDLGTDPQFLSAELLPGRGMNLWQLTAYLPGHGKVALLVAPPVRHAIDVLTGSGDDASGAVSAKYGAAFMAPWAGRLSGFPAPGGGMLQTLWQNERLTFPAETPDALLSARGLLLKRGADDTSVSALADGQAARAVFHAGSFSGGWAGDTELTILIQLSSHTVDLTMTAENVGSGPEPFGMGWLPHFVIPSGDRSDATLVVPSGNRVDGTDHHTGLPTGRVVSTDGPPYDFSRAEGTPLGTTALNETYLDLHGGLLSDGPIVELRDPKWGYGLRLIPLSSNITSLRIIAPANQPWVAIGPDTNVTDPFGHEWDTFGNTGMIVLKPGDKVQWKVRLEIFSTASSGLTALH